MKVHRFLLLSVVSTAFIILYVFQQSEIFRLGYLVDKKQEAFQELLDKNALLRYNVQKNASLIRIGDKLSSSADFQMPNTYRLVKVTVPSGDPGLNGLVPKENMLARLFGVHAEAQAKTINR